MNVTDLTERYFEKVKTDEKSTELFKDLFKSGAYAVLKEIHRLNIPAFTLLDDNDLSKQGFVNMLLNKLVDKDDSHFVNNSLHFIEHKAYHEGEPSIKRIYGNNDKNWMLVQLNDGRLDIAKNVWTNDKREASVWKNQDGKVLDNVLNWRPIYPNGEV